MMLLTVIVASLAAHWWLTRWLKRPLTPTDVYCASVDEAEDRTAAYARDVFTVIGRPGAESVRVDPWESDGKMSA